MNNTIPYYFNMLLIKLYITLILMYWNIKHYLDVNEQPTITQCYDNCRRTKDPIH